MKTKRRYKYVNLGHVIKIRDILGHILNTKMDTDDLSIETYNRIITEAEKFNHDLTLQFGVLASESKNDNDYLDKAEALIKEWLNVKDFDDIIDDVFYGEDVDCDEFKVTLNKLLTNITEIRKTPLDKREYENWG